MTRADLIKELERGIYSQRFTAFMPFIFDAENTYRKDGVTIAIEIVKGDSGGETVCGLDKASHPHFDFNNITPQSVCSVYFNEWQRANIESFAYPMGEVVFNCNVNCGSGRSEKILAKVGKNPTAFLNEQAEFYKRLVEAKPTNRKFLNGWINRITNLRAFLHLQ